MTQMYDGKIIASVGLSTPLSDEDCARVGKLFEEIWRLHDRCVELESALRETLTALGQIIDRDKDVLVEMRALAISHGWRALSPPTGGVADE